MSEALGERFFLLEELGPQPGWGRAIPTSLRFSFARNDENETLCWAFHTEDGGLLPRGYLESVFQRHDQLVGLKGRFRGGAVSLEEGGATDGITLICPAIEGELFLTYLARVPNLPENIIFRLVVDLIQSLKTLAGAPRLFSNVELEDFYIFARDGVLLAVGFCPAFCLLREELALSDFQISRKWTDLMARLHAFVKQGRTVQFRDINAAANKAFRPIFKEFKSGKDRGLRERLQQVEGVFTEELVLSGKGTQRLTIPIHEEEMPIGLLGGFLKQQVIAALPDKLPPPRKESVCALCFSPYLLEGTSDGKARDRLGYLLPPEHWFETSLVDPVNRRLSHPFLKAHHNGIRIRSVYCDESFTVLFGDRESGLPLPSLLAAFDGITCEAMLLIATKFHRALAQFDSAGFDLSLNTPWQVEIHIESGVTHPGWESLLNGELQAWPPWEVKLRMERPTESFIPGENDISWRFVAATLSEKFFPALVVWMLGWKRFQQSTLQGTLEGEPLSGDPRLDALFQAAGEHLEPIHPGQREKFLSLVSEGIEVAVKI